MSSNVRSAEIAVQAAEFMRENLAEHLTTAVVAAHVGYSEFHFIRLFASAFGSSPGPYLTALRFQRAKEMLLTSDHRVNDICHAVGFSSLGTFTRRFTLEVGVSPGGMRRLADTVAETTLSAYSLRGADSVGTVTGSVMLSDSARAVLGTLPQVWVGLFESPRPARLPLAGVLRYGEGEFTLPIPATAPWLLAAAFSHDASPYELFASPNPVVVPAALPVTNGDRRNLVLDLAPHWAPPLLTVLPAAVDGRWA